jgi:pyruvate,water dikinase
LEQTRELDRVSEIIRGWFERGSLPLGLSEQILFAYRALGRPKVAVRSSATAEDLPEISFAGQQDMC